MSTSDNFERADGHLNAFWPLLLISVSFFLVLVYQFSLVLGQRSNMKEQIKRQIDPVTRSIQTQAAFERLANDLLSVADNDPEAKAIAARHGIARNTQAPKN